MKKNYSYYLTLIAIPFIAFMILSLSGGRNGQYSGSPADGGQTCTACHSGGNFGAVATISSNIPSSGFVYGDTYEVTVSVTSSSTKHGFQLCAEDLSVNYVGTYAAGTGSQVVNGGTHMTHTLAGNSQTSWTFDWTAPSFAEGGEITFYAAVNATNSNGSTSGDEVVTTSTTYNVSTAGVSDLEKATLTIYPNPSSNYINLKYDKNLVSNAQLSITNSIGQEVFQSDAIADKIDISNLNTGIYIVRLQANNSVVTSKFIKE